ncbi:FecR domain-containing protein, partial [Vibrio parahaemolyticus]
AYGSGLREAWLADERTGIGETRSFSLPDGTAVDLGAASALAVDYDGETRRVRLLSGEALFTVVPRQGLER